MTPPDKTSNDFPVEQAALGALALVGLFVGLFMTSSAFETDSVTGERTTDPVMIVWGPMILAVGAVSMIAFLVVGALRRR